MRSKRQTPREALSALCLDMQSNPLRFKFCTKPRRHPGRHRYDGVVAEPTLTKGWLLRAALPASVIGLLVGVLAGLAVLR